MAAGGNYADAEPHMLAVTDRGEGLFPENEARAAFYENWGDALGAGEQAVEKLKLALTNWEMWAACSTSGGEGTARMSEVHRVEQKIARLEGRKP
jgi:hypothetical protein